MADDEEEIEEIFGTWEGEKNEAGAPTGTGLAGYPNEDKYEGAMIPKEGLDCAREGKGKYTFKNGAVYEGEWLGNRRHGQGKMTFPDGGVFTGNWNNGARDGQGTFIYANGDWYKGDWKEGKKHGKGKYYSKAGYIGDFEDGEFRSGDWRLSCGGKYSGNFKGNKPALGPGTYTFANGTKQTGRWVSHNSELLWQSV